MTESSDIIFSIEEEARIIEAIRIAEETTSGEIRVHVSQSEDEQPMTSTKQIFQELRMFNTKDRNGVLVHIALGSRNFAIYGDKGIDAVVPNDFWESTKDIMQSNFASGDIVEGICQGIAKIGEQLKTHFPWDEGDINELSDEISYD